LESREPEGTQHLSCIVKLAACHAVQGGPKMKGGPI